MATTKQTTKTEETAAPKAQEPVKEKTVRKFSKDELIQCRSVTPGLLLYNGAKSRLPYSWTNMGDVSFIEYQDLLAAMAIRSDYIFDPLFVIEDEDLLSDPKWQEVKKLYETIDSNVSVKEYLDLPVVKFRRALEQAPKGILNAVKVEIATQISNGTFDSYQKAKIIDELCGTDLKLLMS